ncbi:hypothetical protein [Indioceanicola profundi]|uniref:hypothetical protein n=1 Tax=Indioceanicola profundi TaxID=2220096 RepID=UPI000E6AA2E6|nr:hypothetical protein [Indioceanicola profundi]
MVQTRPTGNGFGNSIGGTATDGQRSGPAAGIAAVERLPPRGRPGNRWPNPRELAALMVNGILRLPARYRRGMFLDVLS